jgi:hypothetical protein
VILGGGCQQPAKPTAARPDEEKIALAPDSPQEAPPELLPEEKNKQVHSQTIPPPIPVEQAQLPRAPKRPVDSWVIFRTAEDSQKDVICNYQWTGQDRLEVLTRNVTRLTLDLRKLPDGAPRRGPWNLQIDKQGFQITGVRGKVLDLIRSPSGIWSVDLEKSPRRD